MRALVCNELGAPSVLRWQEHPEPLVGDTEVLIDVRAAGVNFPDGLMVAGTYQTKPDLPFVPGSEVAGTIAAVGSEVRHLRVGQRIAAFCRIGGYAERVTAPASQVYPLPDEVADVSAAALPVAYGTAFHALVDLADTQPGETVLVLGAAGGVGLAAVQIAQQLGCRVIAVASSAEKLRVCTDHGVDEVIDHRREDLSARLKECTAGRGVDVVVDPVGGALAEAAIRRMAWRGRFLSIGFASGDVPQLGLNRLLLNEGSVHGVLWGAWARRRPDDNAANLDRLVAWCAQGRLRPHLDHVAPMSQGGRALDLVMGRNVLGKIVLAPDDLRPIG